MATHKVGYRLTIGSAVPPKVRRAIETALRVAYRRGWDDAQQMRAEGTTDIPRSYFEDTFLDEILGED